MTADMQQNIQIAFEQVELKNFSSRAKQHMKDAILKIFKDEAPFKEAIGLTPEFENILYTMAYKMFQSGQYKQAIPFFKFLRSVDYNYRYNFGLAACHHYLGEYTDAFGNYIICTNLDRYNPVPYFHLYDCLLKTNNPYNALANLEVALDLAARDPNYDILRERAQMEYNELKKTLEKKVEGESQTSKE